VLVHDPDIVEPPASRSRANHSFGVASFLRRLCPAQRANVTAFEADASCSGSNRDEPVLLVRRQRDVDRALLAHELGVVLTERDGSETHGAIDDDHDRILLSTPPDPVGFC
jgi:hypothetical protein